jgi:hydrogenase maturation protease
MPGEPVLIVGAGRLRHGDDAVGIFVARQAARRLAGLACAQVDLSGWDTLDALNDRRLLIVVDAAEPRADFPPGQWLRIDYAASPDALEACRLRDTHTAGVDAMLRLAGALGRLPPVVWIFAVAGERFAPEERFSPAVRQSAMGLAAQIEADVRAWAATGLA